MAPWDSEWSSNHAHTGITAPLFKIRAARALNFKRGVVKRGKGEGLELSELWGLAR